MHLEESMEEKYDTLFKIKNNEIKTLSFITDLVKWESVCD